MSYQQLQQDDARIALRARLPAADDEASQGETTSVETPEGRLHRLGERLSRRDRDRDSNLRQVTCNITSRHHLLALLA